MLGDVTQYLDHVESSIPTTELPTIGMSSEGSELLLMERKQHQYDLQYLRKEGSLPVSLDGSITSPSTAVMFTLTYFEKELSFMCAMDASIWPSNTLPWQGICFPFSQIKWL